MPAFNVWEQCLDSSRLTLSGTELVMPVALPVVRSMSLPMIVGNAMLVPLLTRRPIRATEMRPLSGLAAFSSLLRTALLFFLSCFAGRLSCFCSATVSPSPTAIVLAPASPLRRLIVLRCQPWIYVKKERVLVHCDSLCLLRGLYQLAQSSAAFRTPGVCGG